MMTVRVSWRGLTIGAALAFALAGPAKADGLAQFDKLLKPMVPPGALTYKSASALGDNGFVLEGVTVTDTSDGGDKKQPIAIKKITVEEFDFAGFEKDHAPNFVKTRIEGIAIGGQPADGVDLKELVGVDHLTADFQLDLRLEPDKKVLTVKTLALDLNGLGHIEVSFILDGVEGDPAQRDKDMDNAELRTASLTFEDRSMLGKLVPAIAKMQGSDAAATVAMAKMMLEGARSGQGQATQAAFDALASFLDDYKKPKGPLTVTLKPDGKLSGASLKNAAGPDDVIKALGLAVSYAGTVPHPSAPVKQ
jgi:hypothetical protein